MQFTERADSEAIQVAALERYHILDTPKEPLFDNIVQLAADICEAPIALMSLIAGGRQWFKAETGLGIRETPIDISVCALAMFDAELAVIPDLAADPRFSGMSIVREAPFLRFYAGARLETPEGVPVGMVCVLDTQPRPAGLSERQQRTLSLLARQAMTELELRRQAEIARSEGEQCALLGRELEHAHDRFQRIANLVPDLVWTSDGLGKRTWFNQRWLDETGLEPDQLMGDGWLDLVHPEDRPETERLFAEALSTGSAIVHEHRLRTHNGTYRWFLVRAEPVKAPDGRIAQWFGSATNIDVYRRANEALRKSEEKFREIADNAPVMGWMTDGSDASSFVSRSWLSFTGQKPDSNGRIDWRDALHPDDRASALELSLAAKAEQLPFQIEYRVRRHDGVYRWMLDLGTPRFSEDGEFLGYIGSVLDISERKEMEKELQERDNRLSLALEAGGMTCWDWDIASDRSFWSEDPAGINGGRTEIPAGYADWFSKVHPEDRAGAERALWNAIHERQLLNSEYRMLREDGDLIWVHVQGRTEYAPDGTPLRITGVITNVTERKRSEETLRVAQAHLLSLSRLTAMGAMASTLAHELNQPLAAIANYVEACRGFLKSGETLDGDFLPGLMEKAVEQSLRAGEIIRRIRNFAVDGQPSRETVDLDGVIELAINNTDLTGVMVVRRIDPAAASILADRVQMEQVVGNLLRNAAEAMAESTERRIDISVRARGDMAELRIADTGCGIPEDEVELLFQPLQSRKNGGLGLGLPICRTIVEAYGGLLYAESGERRGAVLVALLPLAAKARKAA